MPQKFKLPVYLMLILLLAISIVAAVVEATSTSFTVRGGEEVVKSIRLAVEDHVLIKFTVVGQTGSTLAFYVVYPDGSVQNFGSVGSFSHEFACDFEGSCELHFSNVDSVEDKLVTLDYEVQHYIFGVPQMLFLTIIIVLVCLAAVASFVLMGKPR
jgi:hypothetical protein